MLTLDLLKSTTQTETSTSSSSSLSVKITTMTGDITGKYGAFRQLTIDGKIINVDSKRIKGAMLFRPNCDATITINQYANAAGEIKTVVSEVCLQPKDGCGLYVMS